MVLRATRQHSCRTTVARRPSFGGITFGAGWHAQRRFGDCGAFAAGIACRALGAGEACSVGTSGGAASGAGTGSGTANGQAFFSVSMVSAWYVNALLHDCPFARSMSCWVSELSQAWGQYHHGDAQVRRFSFLGYTMCSRSAIAHTTANAWSGAPR